MARNKESGGDLHEPKDSSKIKPKRLRKFERRQLYLDQMLNRDVEPKLKINWDNLHFVGDGVFGDPKIVRGDVIPQGEGDPFLEDYDIDPYNEIPPMPEEELWQLDYDGIILLARSGLIDSHPDAVRRDILMTIKSALDVRDALSLRRGGHLIEEDFLALERAGHLTHEEVLRVLQEPVHPKWNF